LPPLRTSAFRHTFRTISDKISLITLESRTVPEHKAQSQPLWRSFGTCQNHGNAYESRLRVCHALMKGKFGLFGTICFAVSVCFLMYLAVHLYIQNSDQGRIWVIGLIFVLALYVFLLVFGPSIIARAFVRKNPHALGPTDCTFSVEGFSYAGANGHGDFRWTAYTRARETGTNFLIYPQSNFATILPKHCMSDEDMLPVRQILGQAFQEKFRRG